MVEYEFVRFLCGNVRRKLTLALFCAASPAFDLFKHFSTGSVLSEKMHLSTKTRYHLQTRAAQLDESLVPISLAAPHGPSLTNPDLLSSWKEIAVYLSRGVRTVQRWHMSLNMPVHRIGNGPRSPVFAFKSELQTWLRQCQSQDPFPSNATLPSSEPLRVKHQHPKISSKDHWFRFLILQLQLGFTFVQASQRCTKEARRLRCEALARRFCEEAARYAEICNLLPDQRAQFQVKFALLTEELSKFALLTGKVPQTEKLPNFECRFVA